MVTKEPDAAMREGAEPDPIAGPVEPGMAVVPAGRPCSRWLQLGPSPKQAAGVSLVVLAAGAAALLFLQLAVSFEHTNGLAVVRIAEGFAVTALTEQVVRSVEVAAGQSVTAGQLLVRCYDDQEAAALEHLIQAFQVALLDRLRHPTDSANEQSLRTLSREKELAETQIETRSVRAPISGVVGEIRVREGQQLDAGDLVLSLISEATAPAIISIFPGRYQHLIEPGIPLRLELPGYRGAAHHLMVDAVSAELIGPAEALRMLGAHTASCFTPSEPVVLVTSRLPGRTFQCGGQATE